MDARDAGTTATADADRPLRADARRNRERLLAAAREVFAREGTDPTLEAIAKEAGVGVGTLYRHFPRRIDVVEAVYREDVDALVATADEVGRTLPPWAALEAFLRAFVRYALSKRTLLTELREAFEKQPDLKVAARERIVAATASVLGRGQAAGVVRTDVDADDVMALIGPMCTVANLTEPQSERLLAMVLDGLRRPA